MTKYSRLFLEYAAECCVVSRALFLYLLHCAVTVAVEMCRNVVVCLMWYDTPLSAVLSGVRVCESQNSDISRARGFSFCFLVYIRMDLTNISKMVSQKNLTHVIFNIGTLLNCVTKSTKLF